MKADNFKDLYKNLYENENVTNIYEDLNQNEDFDKNEDFNQNEEFDKSENFDKNEDFDKIFTKLKFSLESNFRENPVSLFNFIKNFIYIFVFGLITVVLINYFILELRSIRNS